MKLNLLSIPVLALFAACSALGAGPRTEVFHVVEASGGGWGAAAKARAAMTSLDGIDALHMSGARAVFTLEKGAELPRETVAAAFEEQGMKLETYAREERPRAKARYLVDAGITWAVTAGKVRAALIDETGALDVYFEDEIQILVAEPELFSVSAVEGLLKELKVKFTKVQRAEA